jgi:hypothetical protein
MSAGQESEGGSWASIEVIGSSGEKLGVRSSSRVLLRGIDRIIASVSQFDGATFGPKVALERVHVTP